MLKIIIAFAASTLTSLTVASSSARAEGHAPSPADAPEPKLEPATRYSGRTPIDLTNGIPFNNGTYGKPNLNYEKWASAANVVPGVSELNYPYAEKQDFVAGCEESLQFVEHAIFNWKQPATPNTKDEVKENRTRSIAAMEPALERFKVALDAAKSASKNDWEKAQADARHALVEMRATYSSLHKNTH